MNTRTLRALELADKIATIVEQCASVEERIEILNAVREVLHPHWQGGLAEAAP